MIRFEQSEIRRLLVHFRMAPLRKGSNIYGGFGADGRWRTCKFDYHKDRDIVPAGTAKSIARALLFGDFNEMKKHIRENK
jgi:hypothetical protein